MQFKEYWNEIHKKYSVGEPCYDDWLDKYFYAIDVCKTKVLDLGAGAGHDSLYFVERGFEVVACDYSEVALEKLKHSIESVETMVLDISEKLPFEDNTFDLVVADLSLHYFDEKTTISVMKEIKRILTVGGVLIARVDSISDTNHGAGRGEKLEDNFYFVEGCKKRFFDEKDAKKFFSVIGEPKIRSAEMLRYVKPKKVIEIIVEKENKD